MFSKTSSSKASFTQMYLERRRHVDACQLPATYKGTGSNEWHPLMDKEVRQRITIFKCVLSNFFNRPNYCNLRQTFAICRGIVPDECHGLRYSHAGHGLQLHWYPAVLQSTCPWCWTRSHPWKAFRCCLILQLVVSWNGRCPPTKSSNFC